MAPTTTWFTRLINLSSKQSESFYSQPDSHLPSAPVPARNPCDCFRDDFSEPQAIAPASSEFSVAQLKQVFLLGCIDFKGKGNKRCPIHLSNSANQSTCKWYGHDDVSAGKSCPSRQQPWDPQSCINMHLATESFSSANLRVHMSSQKSHLAFSKEIHLRCESSKRGCISLKWIYIQTRKLF